MGAGIWWLIQLLCFFQAEDGIRDLVRSRGLGDVYKRQRQAIVAGDDVPYAHDLLVRQGASHQLDELVGAKPVSYTHLTLPTSDLV